MLKNLVACSYPLCSMVFPHVSNGIAVNRVKCLLWIWHSAGHCGMRLMASETSKTGDVGLGSGPATSCVTLSIYPKGKGRGKNLP